MAIFWWLRCRKGICRPVLSSVSLAINFRLSTGPINGSRCHLTGEEIQDRTTAVGAQKIGGGGQSEIFTVSRRADPTG